MFHVNAMDLKEEPPLPLRESQHALQEVPNVLPSHLGKGGSPSHSVSPQEKKQHNGLRCKKCFELLVCDDEFLYAPSLRFPVAMPVGGCTPTLPF